MNKIIGILIIIFTFQSLYAVNNPAKLKKYTYHELCEDLQNNIVKPGKKLNKNEIIAVKKFLKSKDISKLKSKDLKFFENAIKKHRYVSLDKSSKNWRRNLTKWPKHNDVGKWFKVFKKISEKSYYNICIDLQSKIFKKNQTLNRKETKVVSDYINSKNVKKLNKRDLIHFESAIKKHKMVQVDKKNQKRFLRVWPKKSEVGSWYKFKKETKKIKPRSKFSKKETMPKKSLKKMNKMEKIKK